MFPRHFPLLLASIMLFAACSPMNGRNGPPNGNAPDAGGGGGMVVTQVQEQLVKAAEALKLTPTQAVLWDAYQEKVGALMADQLKTPVRSLRQNAPQQIAQKVDVVRNRLTAMEDIQEAAVKLYAALDEGQKKVADQSLAQTIPALYSGLGGGGGGTQGERGGERSGGRGGPGGSGAPGGGMGGGMGGGFGRM
jgi:hypothetical protein